MAEQVLFVAGYYLLWMVVMAIWGRIDINRERKR